MDEDMLFGDLSDFGDIDENLLRAYLEGEEVNPELEELLQNYRHDNTPVITRVPFKELWENCITPTLSQTIENVIPLLLLCFVFKLVCSFSKSGSDDNDIPPWLIHFSSLMFGILALQLFFQRTLIYLLVCALVGYSVLVITNWRNRDYCGIVMSLCIVAYLIACEFVLERTVWHSIRGAQIILSMKMIGIAFDLSNGTMIRFPNLFEYLGYAFCVGTVIFGPWISFNEYKNILNQHKRPLSFFWLWKVISSLLASLVFVVCSTCIINWLILDNHWKWFKAYRSAQSFRFSHYFICCLSQVTLVMSGLGATHNNDDVKWDMHIARPYYIELPRSLVEVVTYWNLPMHYWLKTYIFKTTKPLGTFAAVLLTYVASSLLHGLNFQLAAVLLSLGFYTYIEYVFRNKLSKIFNACIQARSCKDCYHEYKHNNPYVIAANICFGFLSVFHLAYLGLMFDSSPGEESGYSMNHTLDKWSALDFSSHWVALGTYIFHLLI
ncbi:hypothetical protein ACJMK2_015812 [Sinanodonta woodiana]|uniref:Protein-serine O-palmitoleoyltransferase porcupine n=1 Tax=Sinanodonta woodiana TaxID=1069815 RepID=A0ABD3USK8_SINWO